jgi:hypothetical protein
LKTPSLMLNVYARCFLPKSMSPIINLVMSMSSCYVIRCRFEGGRSDGAVQQVSRESLVERPKLLLRSMTSCVDLSRTLRMISALRVP